MGGGAKHQECGERGEKWGAQHSPLGIRETERLAANGGEKRFNHRRGGVG
jgi:hypothetical protein